MNTGIAVFLEQYTKKNCVGLWSFPIARENSRPDANFLPSVFTFTSNNTEVENMYDFYFCLCVNGLKMHQGIYINQALSPTVLYKSIQIMLHLVAGVGLHVYALDVDNAFQST